MKLYAWQTKAARRLEAALRKHKRVLGVSPTSSGKTVIGAAIIRKRGSKARVLWLAHRIELIRQARDQLVATGIRASDIGLVSGAERENEGARIVVSSIGLAGKLDLRRFDLVVIDEAHRSAAASYRAVLAKTKAQVLGLTATPWRLDGQPLGDVYRHLEVLAGTTELEHGRFIASPITYGMPREKAKGLVRGAGGKKDFNQRKLSRAMQLPRLMADVVKETQRLAPNKRTLVFAVDRAHGRKLLGRYKAAKVRAEYLDGETPDHERDAILARLAAGRTQLVVNVDVLAEGYDCPAVKCVAIVRPTKSLTRFLQYCGRATRFFGGQRPIILDHAGNCWRHGLPNAERADLWSLDGAASEVTGEAPIRHCPECGAVAPAAILVCPECGAELRTKGERAAARIELERLEFDREEMARKHTELAKVAKARGWSKAQLASAMRDLS